MRNGETSRSLPGNFGIANRVLRRSPNYLPGPSARPTCSSPTSGSLPAGSQGRSPASSHSPIFQKSSDFCFSLLNSEFRKPRNDRPTGKICGRVFRMTAFHSNGGHGRLPRCLRKQHGNPLSGNRLGHRHAVADCSRWPPGRARPTAWTSRTPHSGGRHEITSSPDQRIRRIDGPVYVREPVLPVTQSTVSPVAG